METIDPRAMNIFERKTCKRNRQVILLLQVPYIRYSHLGEQRCVFIIDLD